MDEDRHVSEQKATPPSEQQVSTFLCIVEEITNRRIRGWAIDKADQSRDLSLQFVVNGRPLGWATELSIRDDVVAAGYAKADVGFTFDFPSEALEDKPLEIHIRDNFGLPVVFNVENTERISYELPQRSPIPAQHSMLDGHLDGIFDGVVRGWATDQQNVNHPLDVTLYIDGICIHRRKADQLREDVRQHMGHPTGLVGFEFLVPRKFKDGREHVARVLLDDNKALTCSTMGFPQDDIRFSEQPATLIRSHIDGLDGGFLKGWVVRMEPHETRFRGSCRVQVTCSDTVVALLVADKYRGDVARSLDGDARCGFQFALPQDIYRSGSRSLHFKLIPENIELEGSPFITSVIPDYMMGRILQITDALQTLALETDRIRREIDTLLPRSTFNLDNYDSWARIYYNGLSNRVSSTRGQIATPDMLVSVLIPTYKPHLPDFVEAVESVICQTYSNWELIVVDDGSRSEELDATMSEFCCRDQRIRYIKLKRNVNISAATNAAISHAKGEWLAFFDHDDVLVKEALEVMILAAYQAKAVVVYSDEDKIDEAGFFLEPNLKPDFNYRYLIGTNYICHFLMARSEEVKKAGPLRTVYNGAQDHDLILRLTEVVPHDKILHVPELLYHWRKTPNSTASDISTKQYAVQAGVACVKAHLKRVSRKANVSAINNVTLYRVDWSSTPRSAVSIIIPFHNQVSMTRECVTKLLSITEYSNFELILVDNWSDDEEILDWYHKLISEDRRVRFIRVEEPFNYSRLNNIAARSCKSEFLLFMNNDVFVEHSDWLRVIVAEAEAFAEVAIVGGKFVYPNRTVQHGGVIVGRGVIAAHAHLGLKEVDYGYAGRASVPQEVSAVTAAGMLIRASVFREVNGFDEVNLKIAYNDIDLCLKVRQLGYKVIWTPLWTAEHRESASRGADDADNSARVRLRGEQITMRDRWGRSIDVDPHFNRWFKNEGQPYYDLVDPGQI